MTDLRSKLLAVISRLDSLVRNPNLQQDWIHYKKLVRRARTETDKTSADFEQEKNLEKSILKIEEKVIKGSMLYNVTLQRSAGSKVVIEELSDHIRTALADVETSGRNEGFINSVCLLVLLCSVSRQEDRRLVSRVLEVYRRLGVNLVVSDPGTVWDISRFWESVAPVFGEQTNAQFIKQAGLIESQQATWFSSKLSGILAFSKATQAQLGQLMLSLEPKLNRAVDLTLPQITERVDLILTVLDVAKSASEAVKLILASFSEYSRPMTSSSILALGQLLCQICNVVEFFQSHGDSINSLLERGTQHTQFLLLNLIQTARKSVVSDKKYSETKLDHLSILILAEKCLSGPGNRRREILAKITFGFSGSGRSLFKDSEWKTITALLDKFTKLISFWDNLDSTQFIPYLSWQLDILGVMLEYIYSTKTPEKIKPLFQMWSRSRFNIDTISGDQSETVLRSKLEQLLEDRVVDRVCVEVETQLRLIIHDRAGIQLDSRNPFKTLPTDLQGFLTLDPVPVWDRQVSIKQRVEDYLSRVFYNLTTVSLSNWRTYGEMRQLAESFWDTRIRIQENTGSRSFIHKKTPGIIIF